MSKLIYKFESISAWQGAQTPSHKREYSRFDTKWTDTLAELERELRHLNYRVDSVVLKTFHRPYDLRKDGMLRSDVRAPENPGVIVQFRRLDLKSKTFIEMQFACDKFLQWKDNVLAIARAMNALRLVDRYGVTSGQGEASQYEGFRKTLPPVIPLGQMSVDEAAIMISKFSPFAWEGIKNHRDTFEQAYKMAAFKAHPDKNGNHDDMARINLAREVLQKHFS